ncbi:MAG: hypothetical protein MUF21_02615 [Gemmatimonadaceae bacterium]|jgi:hypothetical protein|nr:hypothetical protein [Gemmatimonadaceae bacterium]
MQARWKAWLLATFVAVAWPSLGSAQAPSGPQPPVKLKPDGFELGQNTPNPTAGEARFPFLVGDPPTCRDPRRSYRVTLRLYNLLAQEVAVPLLLGPNGEQEGARRLENLTLTCRQYVAWWDGKVSASQRDAPDGIYLYRLEVNGRAVVKKMVVRR